MKKFLVFSLALACAATLFAQNPRVDFKNNRDMAADAYWAYPGPTGQLTPTPEGYIPYYISHYGRHGSRWLIDPKDYTEPVAILKEADKAGKLTATGKDVLRKVGLIRAEAYRRDGELTQRGAEQHKAIAKRMYERFPEVFAGKTNVDAKSTIVIRCILSMENALQQLLVANPQLQITHDASHHDMYYMNLNDTALRAKRSAPAVNEALEAFSKKHDNYERVMQTIFNDEAYWHDSIDASQLNRMLYKLASNVQSTELRHKLSLYDLFTQGELYDNWLKDNAYWYVAYGPSPLSGNVQPFSQRNLLRKIIVEADSCIALPHPGATLRYGHDTMVMPLTCLLDLNGCGRQISDLEQLDDANWCDYKIIPMASNLQFVFYRRSPADKDVIFKVLLCEDEATLPIKTDIAPYYHWRDFKDYYLKKLDAYSGK